MFKKVKLSLLAMFCFLLAAGQSFAAVDLAGFSVDTATPEALAATVLVALGVIWGIRKLIKLVNRS